MAERLWMRDPGEWYRDLLALECFIKGRSTSDEICNMACVRLMQREEYRNKVLDHLARKRRTTREALIEDILTGKATPLSPDDYKQIVESNPDPDPDPVEPDQ